MFRYQKMTAVM